MILNRAEVSQNRCNGTQSNNNEAKKHYFTPKIAKPKVFIKRKRLFWVIFGKIILHFLIVPKVKKAVIIVSDGLRIHDLS